MRIHHGMSVIAIGLILFGCDSASPGPRVSVTAVSSTYGQRAVVGTALALPLQVKVLFDGVPKAGAIVTWTVSDGGTIPSSSITDAAGIAAAPWVLGTLAGIRSATARLAIDRAIAVFFSAHGLPGPVAGLQRGLGSGVTLPSNTTLDFRLAVQATDQYGNGVSGQTIIWTVTSGALTPVAVDSTTDVDGQSNAAFAPTATQGDMIVEAALAQGGAAVSFGLTVAPPGKTVTLDPGGPTPAFVSLDNGTSPAVDTIAAGQTIMWILEPFDYDLHGLISVGTPALPAVGNFPFANPSALIVTFPAPGTYHYADSHDDATTGTVVVQ